MVLAVKPIWTEWEKRSLAKARENGNGCQGVLLLQLPDYNSAMSEGPAKERWFRWSLRTLFVAVTVLGVLLGCAAYNLNWIRQRHVALSSGRFSAVAYQKSDGVRAPGLLWLFGEPSYSGIVIHLRERDPYVPTPVEESELIEVCKLFPEVRQNFIQWVPPTEPDPARH